MSKIHPCGLTAQAIRQHELGSRPLGKASLLALKHWQEAERLKAKIEELYIRIDALEKVLNPDKV